MDRILLTGASGYVGGLLLERLASLGLPATVAGRRLLRSRPADIDIREVMVGNIGPDTDWREGLRECRVVVHAAAQLPATGTPEAVYTAVNDLGTARLVEQALDAGVRRFVLLSTAGVAVPAHSSSAVIDDATPAEPANPYALSKWRGECHVHRLGASGIEWAVLRPPIVYGAAAGGNWRLLQRLAASPVPLPLGLVRNRRNMVAAANLVDAVSHLVRHDGSGWLNDTFLVADRESVSLADILRLLREGMGRKARLLPLPVFMLSAGLAMLGKRLVAESLLGDLEIDSSRFGQVFGWKPPLTATDAIRASGRGFAERLGNRADFPDFAGTRRS